MDLMELTAKDLMQTKVERISETATLLSAAKQMRDKGVSSLVVERAHDRDAWGIITRKDVVEALVEEDALEGAYLVEHVMSKPVFTVPGSLAVIHCLQMMKMVGVRRLPVVEGDQLVGILSNTDLFKKLTVGL
ncbi:MAG: CBS domain-containing protein [Planctomycetes bacterium]|nr:CBS domain-containing protein [Planctomycetota bacterium]